MKRSSDLKTLFLRGDYRDLLDTVEITQVAGLADEEFTFFIGSLGFNGRKEEAETFFLKRKNQLSDKSIVACQFFIGIAFCRAGQYKKARSYFAINLSRARKTSNELTQFYAYQGLGFYRYFCARYEKARWAAEKALGASTFAGFAYGRTLASDLYGHTLVQLGQIHTGLLHLAQAQDLATQIGNGGLSKAIQITQMIYRAQHGLEPQKSLSLLEDAIKLLDPQNSHSRCGLLLEIANQLMLRGQVIRAAKELDKASTIIYQSQHGRYRHMLSLRLAELSYRSGQFASALHLVQMVKSQLDRMHDRLLFIKAIGLELKLLNRLEMSSSIEAHDKLKTLTLESTSAIAKMILQRTDGQFQTSTEDRIALLFQKVKQDPSSAIPELISEGYLGFLPQALGVENEKKVIVVGLAGRDCAVIDQGEIYHSGKEMPRQIYDLLALLAQGERSKEKIIATLWNYEYHPIRHDALIYQAIVKLRKFLGPGHDWVEATESGYRIQRNILIKIMTTKKNTEKEPTIEKTDAWDSSRALNTRQMQILSLLKKKRSIGVADCIEEFKVSDMTLRRDFSELMKLGLVDRSGKARATRYELKVN